MTRKERHEHYKDGYEIFKVNSGSRGLPLCYTLKSERIHPDSLHFPELFLFKPKHNYSFWTCGLSDKDSYNTRELILLFCIEMTGGKE